MFRSHVSVRGFGASIAVLKGDDYVSGIVDAPLLPHRVSTGFADVGWVEVNPTPLVLLPAVWTDCLCCSGTQL